MFRMNGMPRAQGCARAVEHILVSLDTRLPRQLLLRRLKRLLLVLYLLHPCSRASYGPETSFPPQLKLKRRASH